MGEGGGANDDDSIMAIIIDNDDEQWSPIINLVSKKCQWLYAIKYVHLLNVAKCKLG